MIVSNDVKWIGVNDRDIELFEAQFAVEKGMAYNSYLILDEKTVVMDSVEGDFANQWINKIDSELKGKSPDYIVISHMEPDHSSGLDKFLNKYPQTKVVSCDKTFVMIKNFFGIDLTDKKVVIKEGDTLNLGKHELTFIAAPMVHWPEVMMTYDKTDKILFSADAFGKFGTTDADEDWACEARRYYFGIVGKYGAQVKNLLKKASALQIEKICPLHGPVLTENLSYYLNLYDIWSSYGVETEGVAICYTSVYGHTEKAALLLAEKLKEKGCPKVAVTNLIKEDMAEAVEDAFRYGKIVLATTTYNADIFPTMKTFIEHLTERNYQNKTIGFIENGSWAPFAAKAMKNMFENSKNITFTENNVKILSAVTNENIIQINALADELLK
ncbi:MAG: FprA family A-type flavoprotein [Clostridia bacterium]|nr:FprA family A-type flavoprotein [Clostridia bacterium]